MIDVTLIRETAAPAPTRSRHFKTPRGWPEWIAQVLASAGAATSAAMPVTPAVAAYPAAFPAAAAALHAALREVDDAVTTADDWAVTVARHQVFLARRALRAMLDATVSAGPGSRLEWCLCGEDARAA